MDVHRPMTKGKRVMNSSIVSTRRLLTRVVVSTLLLLASTNGFSGAAASADGATQVSGVAFPWPVAPATCDPGALGAVDYVLAMPAGSGDLVGCLYGVRHPAGQTPGGPISTRADEVFVGCWGETCGSFALTAHITGNWEGAPGVSDQKNGRCQHKIVSGTGSGGFTGVEGRLDFKDILIRDDSGSVVGVEFDYRGHLTAA